MSAAPLPQNLIKELRKSWSTVKRGLKATGDVDLLQNLRNFIANQNSVDDRFTLKRLISQTAAEHRQQGFSSKYFTELGRAVRIYLKQEMDESKYTKTIDEAWKTLFTALYLEMEWQVAQDVSIEKCKLRRQCMNTFRVNTALGIPTSRLHFPC